MTVKELIELLSKQDPDDLVVLSMDSEGNGFNEMADYSIMNYRTGGYAGDIGYRELTEEMEKQGYAEEDVMLDGQPCIVLWP